MWIYRDCQLDSRLQLHELLITQVQRNKKNKVVHWMV